MDMFRIHVLSHKHSHHLDNKPGSFLAVFDPELVLTGSWVVALEELATQSTFFNLTAGQGNFIYFTEDVGTPLALPPGHYTVEGAVDGILELIRQVHLREEVKIIYNKLCDLVEISITTDITHPIINARPPSVIPQILGFTKGSWRIGHGKHVGRPELASIQELYIHASLIHSQHVGGCCIPVLRIVPIATQFGDAISKEFINLQFHPVSQDVLHSARFEIRDRSGKLMEFYPDTSVMLTLLFRRISDREVTI
jgi:hypothetical protein